MGCKPLGEILLGMGAIDSLKLKSALAFQRQWGTPLGRALVENNLCSREQVLVGLARQAGMSVIDLSTVQPSAAALASIDALDAVRSVSGKSRVVAHLAHDEAIERAIAKHFQGVSSAEPASEGTAARPQSELEFELG